VTRSLKLVVQGVTVAAVLGLLVLLAWKVVQQEQSTAADAVASGRTGPAPSFDLPTLDGGGRLTLSALRGKAVVVNFWASWCAPCKDEAPLLEAAWRNRRKDGLVVVGVNVQDLSSDAKRFARRAGLTFPLVREGAGGRTADRYGLTGLPETFFVDRRGRVVDVHIQGGIDIEANREKFERGVRLALRT
jgi:cytochrome c biogenesis protein CcmG, thiol:disulfide interchange protein DsbE